MVQANGYIYGFGYTCISRGCNYKCHVSLLVLRFAILQIGGRYEDCNSTWWRFDQMSFFYMVNVHLLSMIERLIHWTIQWFHRICGAELGSYRGWVNIVSIYPRRQNWVHLQTIEVSFDLQDIYGPPMYIYIYIRVHQW